ncbi:MAG: hypothetical protein ACETWM_21345 [Candidatus Lokiarchaeia archaeon]
MTTDQEVRIVGVKLIAAFSLEPAACCIPIAYYYLIVLSRLFSQIVSRSSHKGGMEQQIDV